MTKDIKYINMTVLDVTETGMNVNLNVEADPVDSYTIDVDIHADIGNASKKNYRYHIDISATLYNFYEGKEFKSETEIVQYISDLFNQDLIDLIQCYDRLIINNTYAS